MIDFTVPSEIRAFLPRLRDFVDDEVEPVEATLSEDDYRGAGGRVEAEVLPTLREKARAAGVYGPQLPQEYGGLGLGMTALAFVSELCGPYPLASYAINMMAPEESTMHLLHQFGSRDQRERWLEPLAAGEIRSCFGMTEPDAGSDPRRISSTATRLEDRGWKINAHKVFTSGAIGAACCVVMAVTDDSVSPGKGISMFIVPTESEGFEIVRDLDTMGCHFLGGHPEIRLNDVRVGPEAQLGELGQGFEMAQARLGIGRIGHAMRWIGIAQTALELAARRALERETFGEALANRQAIQWWLADGAMQVWSCRLMVLNTLWKIETGREHRTEVSMVKTHTAEVLGEVLDKALQIFGGWGYTTDFPIERWYRDARAARIYDGPSEVHRALVARRFLREVARTGRAARTCGDPLAVAAEGKAIA